MGMEFECPHCGHRHKTVGVFCASCGQKMGTPKMVKVREPIDLGRILGALVKGTIMIVIAVIGGAALWPLSPSTPVSDYDRMQKFAIAIEKLNAAIDDHKPAEQVFAESEINTYFATKIQRLQEKGGNLSDFTMALHGLTFNLTTNLQVRATAISAVGPIRVSYQVTGTPVVDRQGFSFRVTEARLGHLKMPHPAAREWVADKVFMVVGGLAAERNVLNNATKLELFPGRVRIVVGGVRPSA